MALSDQTPAQQPRDSALIAAARQRPDSLRQSITRTLALAAHARAERISAAYVTDALRLAAIYARAWSDPFHVRQVSYFAHWSRARRLAKTDADSLRVAGNLAFGRDGVPAALRLWRKSLQRATAAGDSAGRAAALGSIGAGFYQSGKLDSASLYLTRARDLASSIGDLRTLGNAVGNLASVSKDRGEFAQAAEQYRRASDIRARTGDTRGIAADQNNLGEVARALGDYDGARRAYENALELNRSGNRPQYAAINLSNLADLATFAGDYADAEKRYREALALHTGAGERAQTAFVLHDLALLAARRGDYRSAHAGLLEALRIHEDAGAAQEATTVRLDLADVLSAMGELDAAIGTLREAERAAAATEAAPALLARVALTRADLAVDVGTLADAESAYKEAERLFRLSGDEAGRAEAQQGRALLLHVRRDDAAALTLLDLAARGQTRAGDRRSAALTHLLTGTIQSSRGDTVAARKTLQRTLDSLRNLGDAVGEAGALRALADLAAQRGSTLLAESLYRLGLKRLGTLHAPDVRWQLHAGLGDALRSRGALAAAAVELRAATVAIEQVSTRLRSEERRAGYLADKWQVYASLARTEHLRGHHAEAFAASERLRARQLLDLMARGRIARPNQVSAREQDLRRRITDLSLEVAAADFSGEAAREPAMATRSVDAAREQLDQAQQAYARLLVELRERDPAYARLVSGESVSWRDVAARLTRDQAMLEYLVTDSSALAFVITRDSVTAIDLDVDGKTLSNLVDFARRTMDRPASPASELWRPPLRRLYQYVIEPVDRSGLLKGKRELVIVPHGELHFLSFASLLASQTMPDRFLVERFDIAYAPSASLWVRLGERAANRRVSSVLALAPRVERLPASRAEVAAIRAINGRKTTVLTGQAASEQYLVQAAPAQDIIHLATFGVLNKHNPLFSYVELAAGGGSDGRLEVHEVFGLNLRARLVVLSACQTAVGSGAVADVPPGDDWVGLVQSFLYAGAGGVLASLWPVDDRATAQLMERFHRKLRQHNVQSAALAQAQRAVLHDPATAHPFYWAGFVLTTTSAGN